MIRLPPSRIDLTPEDVLAVTTRLRECRKSKIFNHGYLPSKVAFSLSPGTNEQLAWLMNSFPLPVSASDGNSTSHGLFAPNSTAEPTQSPFYEQYYVEPLLKSDVDQSVPAASIRLLHHSVVSELSFNEHGARLSSNGDDLSKQLKQLNVSHDALIYGTLERETATNSSQIASFDDAPNTSYVDRLFPSIHHDDDLHQVDDSLGSLSAQNRIFEELSMKFSNEDPRNNDCDLKALRKTEDFDRTSMGIDSIDCGSISLLPRSIEAYRRSSRTSALPRSPLYISQAVASSSPEKAPESKSSGSQSDKESNSQRIELRKRLRKYEQQSLQASSKESESDAGSASCNSGTDNSSDDEFMGYIPPPGSSPSDINYSSPSDNASVLHHSPFSLSQQSPSASNSQKSPSEMTLTEADTSFDMPLPASSPPSPSMIRTFDGQSSSPSEEDFPTLGYVDTSRRHSTEIDQISMMASPVTPTDRTDEHAVIPSFSLLATPRRSIAVYDDRLPPDTQPQTPANRHAGPFNPAFTAPAAPIGSNRSLFRWRSIRQQRPTGAAHVGSNESRGTNGQENVSVEGERERAVQRVLGDSSVMLRVDNWIRSSAGHELQRTPPSSSWLQRI